MDGWTEHVSGSETSHDVDPWPADCRLATYPSVIWIRADQRPTKKYEWFTHWTWCALELAPWACPAAQVRPRDLAALRHHGVSAQKSKLKLTLNTQNHKRTKVGGFVDVLMIVGSTAPFPTSTYNTRAAHGPLPLAPWHQCTPPMRQRWLAPHPQALARTCPVRPGGGTQKNLVFSKLLGQFAVPRLLYSGARIFIVGVCKGSEQNNGAIPPKGLLVII